MRSQELFSEKYNTFILAFNNQNMQHNICNTWMNYDYDLNSRVLEG